MTAPLSTALLPPGVVRYPVDGVLVIATRKAFHQDVLDLLGRGATEVRIDLAGCPYIDASGLGVLIQLANKARNAFGAKIVLERPNEDLRALFALTKLDTLFRFEPMTEAPAPAEDRIVGRGR